MSHILRRVGSTQITQRLPTRVLTSHLPSSQPCHRSLPLCFTSFSKFPSAASASFSMRSGPPTPHITIPGKGGRPASFATPAYMTREVGATGTKDWRQFLQLNGKDISAWHDIPLLAQGSSHQQLLFNYVNEIPKGTLAKMEIATKEALSPIKQDIKKEKLRVFTFGTLPFNYGCLPQTWENPYEAHPLTKMNGDNDPIDVVELSDSALVMGSVSAVKILGVLALLDEGETDWKLLAIDAAHPLANSLKNKEDIERHFPGKLHTVREWFRNYKTTDGKPQNQFAFEEQIMDVGLAHKVIWETHGEWAKLCKSEVPKGDLWIPATVPAAAKGEETK